MVKMGICHNPDAYCNECSVKWTHTREMYRLKLFGTEWTVCKGCADRLFQKLLRASCMYDGKVKTKEDKERAARERRISEEG